MPDVIVVGGGPAGSASAIGFAERGFSVRLFDSRRFPRSKPCAELLSPEGVALVEALGVPIRSLGGHSEPVHGIHLITETTSHRLGYPDDGQSRTAIGIRREVLDEALLTRARSVGVAICERSSVFGLIRSGSRVSGVQVRDARGNRQVVQGNLVVGADGLHSVVRRETAGSRRWFWPVRTGLVAHVPGVELEPGWAEMHVGRGVYCGLAPLGDGLTNVGLVGPASEVRRVGAERYFHQAIDRLPTLQRRLPASSQVGPIRGLGPLAVSARAPQGEGWILVGDAAAFFDPFTGEGMFEALKGAKLAVETLGESLGADRRDGSYRRARQAAFRAKRLLDVVIQLFVGRPALFNWALERLNRRPAEARILAGIIGNYGNPGTALRPDYLWRLLRP